MRSSGMRPVAIECPTRTMPRRSSIAVPVISTELWESSTQSTGTSWMRMPARSAMTSNSVSKNQLVSCTYGSTCSAAS